MAGDPYELAKFYEEYLKEVAEYYFNRGAEYSSEEVEEKMNEFFGEILGVVREQYLTEEGCWETSNFVIQFQTCPTVVLNTGDYSIEVHDVESSYRYIIHDKEVREFIDYLHEYYSRYVHDCQNL